MWYDEQIVLNDIEEIKGKRSSLSGVVRRVNKMGNKSNRLGKGTVEEDEEVDFGITEEQNRWICVNVEFQF